MISKGATLAGSPREVAEQSDVVFTIVGFPDDVESVILGSDGVLAGSAGDDDRRHDDQPSLVGRRDRVREAERKVASIDAPVSGGDTGARNAALVNHGRRRCRQRSKRIDPLLRLMGKTIVHQGGPGCGQHTKMVNQTLIASGMIAVCEGLLYAHKGRARSADCVAKRRLGRGGKLVACRILAPRMIDGDFDPGFFVEHFIKDMRIALEEAAAMNLALPGLALAHQLYQAVAAQGHAKMARRHCCWHWRN